ncbi:imm11 family protein [Chryseobacterium zhengzhouense]|uniref:Imm11 family protein n=1 Tax=Chryseobacterium zhengzhouense TaxID=1636086 RepID=A0ABW2M607_9FLAO
MRKIVYYRMKLSTESEIVGTWPQLDVPKNYFKIINNFEILQFREFPSVEPNLDNFIFKRGAKLTDLLSSYLPSTSVGVFVNQKFRDLIVNFNVKNFRFYNSSLIAADKDFTKKLAENPYFFLHLIYVNEIVDFSQSVFKDLKTGQLIEVNNEDQLPLFLSPKKLVLKETLDLFRSPFDVDFLVSESLKKAMEEANISGVWFEEFKGNEFYIEE